MRETLRDGGKRGLVLHGPRERSEPMMHNRAAGEIPLGRLLFFPFSFPGYHRGAFEWAALEKRKIFFESKLSDEDELYFFFFSA